MESSVSNMKMENGGTKTTVGNGIKNFFKNFADYCQKMNVMSLYIVRSDF